MKRNGVHAPVAREQMWEPARKVRDTYAITPGAPFYKCEFRFYSLARWKEEGMPQDMVPPNADLYGFWEYYLLADLFDFDLPAYFLLQGLGWSEAAFEPAFETKVVEAGEKYDLVQDAAGRKAQYPKGRREGVMPHYVDYPVKDMKTWNEDVAWRLDPATPERYADLEARMANAQATAACGMIIAQNLIGGYLYLTSLMGPERLLYAFYDAPDLVHACMQAWLALADAVTARHQEYVTIDQLVLAEDICHKSGALISHRMMQEFLFPYYQQLIANTRARQIDRTRHLYVQVDSDGLAAPIIPYYREAIGMDIIGPLEALEGCDVVEIGKQYPDLVIVGGIDNHALARGKEAIDAHLAHILPPMRQRGGYIPTCGHGVLEHVPYENYRHYRRRCVELGG